MPADATRVERTGSIGAGAPVVIEVRDVAKTFRIPSQRVDTLKERVLGAFAPSQPRMLEALRGVSFDVRRGEFVGIVGRNGSGKSTLLKILASIYRADRGSVRVAGRIAPFIELGVGFNPEMTAVDNVVLNGVMMGLTPREARARFEGVMAFAELEEFADLKLKNYSSGMMVRLAFALMLQVDADILLFDEVLAVGDASFQQRCAEAFRRLHEEGKTIVLVTHDMYAVERSCDRALILEQGEIERIGDPAAVARDYLQVNLRKQLAAAERREHRVGGGAFEVERTWVEGDRGPITDPIAGRIEITFCADLRALAAPEETFISIEIRDGQGSPVLALPYRSLADGGAPIREGERIRVRLRLKAPDGLGTYFVHCGLASDPNGVDQHTLIENAAGFLVYDPAPEERPAVEHEMEIEREPAG